ncbi:aromatic ring-hydroxylating dioxygenase subunit alpha [Rhodospirillales bacterium YIM 152171]|uniref:Aromatic ring-hydroxylating dioxygenase subunit alpha n=1 Tax=Marinimicrococcus flavescens TaxID=3031815 RepID=A0AAP4D4M9_9PROT|nr:aromatic ring-hydroxylating dioxygenase subunit alpha [Marinimicrococcus flavescens]
MRNAWYVASWSKDVGRELRPTRILGEDIVLYRTESGRPAALEDACPHRKLPLSAGKLIGDTVECGYHGLTFDCSGSCVRAPTQEGMIPKRAVVRSYPVADKWNLLWIWMGEPELANPDEIFPIENFENPSWGMTDGGEMDIACNYLYVVDNLLDPSHVAWVHVSSFAGAGTENQPLEIDTLENGVLVSRWIHDRPVPPYYADLVKFEGNCDRKQHYECQLPAIAINKSVFSPAGTGGADKPLHEKTFVNISYNFMTPIDEENTRYYWFQHRNTDPDDKAISERMLAGARMAFIEDRDILVRVQKGMAERKTPYLNLGLDAGAMRFRKLLERRMEQEQQRQV